MLQQMRKLPKWVAFIFFLPLVVSFGIWGIGDIFRGSVDTSVAKVGGSKVEYADFLRVFENTRRNAAQRFGGQLPAAESSALGKTVLQKEIDYTALDNVASRLGLVTTDDQVASTIRAIPGFHGPLGGFDEATFQRAISRLNYSEVGFVAEIRRELTRDQLIQAGTSAIIPPPDYARAFFSYFNERRAVLYIVLPPDAGGTIAPPPDPVLETYLKAHATDFSTPDYRELTYATIAPDEVANQVQVTDAQLHQTYELRKDVYVIPDRRDVQRINFPNEAAAKAAKARIDAGTKFEDIAAARGVSANDMNLGSLAEADLGPVQGRVAFSLPVGGISQPVKYTFGWSLLRISRIVPGSTKTFDDVKADIKAELTKELAGSKIEDIVNAFEDARNAGDDLVEAAKKVGMRVVRVQATDAKGLGPNGGRADVPSTREFLDQVFKADIGTEGDAFATPDGSRFVIKVDGEIPSKLKPLDSVRAQATAAWIGDQRHAKLTGIASDLAQKVSSSAALEAIATQYHVRVQSSPALERGAATPEFTRAFNAKVFASRPGKAVYGATADGQSDIVAWVSGVVHPPLPLMDPRYQKFIQQVGNQIADDLQDSMAASARADQGVTINHQQVDRAIGGEGS